MAIKNHIPNSITSLNLFSGVLATVFAVSGNLHAATILIFCGAVFDYFDGFVARLLHVSSDIGKELDSLADLISFGFAPAAMYSTYVKYLLTGDFTTSLATLELTQLLWVMSPLILVVFAALRLAKFNLDTRQTETFLGLTTTATGLFTASLLWFVSDHLQAFSCVRPIYVLIMVVIFCALLVSEIPMFSLKIKHFGWRGNEMRFVLLLIAIMSIVCLGIGGVALTIALYIIFSLVRAAIA
ncbi:MAG: CDP-alcohol phosphatidyltransferase family protein [Marinilabiliaceae bacterium]|jgi:CDP-diacylglycerol--serine O-phosphatidyltransferase|nr:CDP-alcohol phosphatidyltransferase [Bacteroidales bacterium]MCR5695896.1 CDP-alcohol phosphatidyltransferase family protein [Marinilabiliaceae bacterium]